MKHLIILLLAMAAACMGVTGCGRHSENAADNGSATDSILSDTDSAALLNEPYVEPSANVDFLFEDFLYTFLSDARFQAHRIAYPLPFANHGKHETIASGHWNYQPLYSKDDTYVIMFNQGIASLNSQDSTSTFVSIEWSDLKAQTCSAFVFEKRGKKWLLTSLAHDSLDNETDFGFYTFFRRFATDSLYRQQHICDPFTFKTYDTDSYQTIDGLLNAEQWPDFAPEIPSQYIARFNYGRKSRRQSRTRTIVITGADAGMSCALHFRYHRGQWMLSGMEDV